MKEIVNKPKISKWVGGMYVILTIFVLTIFVSVPFASNILLSPLNLQILFFGIMIFLLFVLVLVTYSLYSTRYIIRDGVLHSWSPFAVINIKLTDIKSAEKMIIPFHFRVGASLYSGRFYVPSLGWTKGIITNLTDGVLITTRNKKRYLITPSSPEKFVKLLKKH